MTIIGDIPRSTALLLALIGVGALALIVALLPSSVSIEARSEPVPSDLVPIRLASLAIPQANPYDAIAEHSVFNSDHAKDQPPPPPKPPPPPPLENYQLDGVIVAMSNTLALIERKADRSVIRVRTGDAFDGWTVDQIGRGVVQVNGGGQTGTLSIPRAAGRVTMHGVTTLMSATQDLSQ
jgi:hypothetical protein